MSPESIINYGDLSEFLLDPTNPRLGLADIGEQIEQSRVMELMKDWSLEELAMSFLESGFWPQEAVIVVKEKLYGEPEKLVVVEGNRRIAALRYLKQSLDGDPPSARWKELIEGIDTNPTLFTEIPYFLINNRSEAVAYLGFRHVTGIKEWDPGQKAEYISYLIDKIGLSYDQVRKKIGSTTEVVRRSYISYQVFLQLEKLGDTVSVEAVQDKFSVLFLALRENGIQQFLGINIKAEPPEAKNPIPEGNFENLRYFTNWLFGIKDKIDPLFSDSRQVHNYSLILSNPEAVIYLKAAEKPNFELALQKAGIEQEELIQHIENATDEIEQALSRIHLYLDLDNSKKVIRRFAMGARELIKKIPALWEEIIKDEGEK
ncbi:hypothetical protein ACFLTT_02250 [Chloroflexota bacterium]